MKRLLFFCVLLFSAGCSTLQGYPDRSDNYESELSALSEYFKPETISECIKKTSENEKRLCRDNIVHARIRAIDINFNRFQQAATKEKIQLNVGFDWAVLGLGGAGAVIDNSNTQSILAAISGGLTGAKGSIDKNVYFEKTMPVLLAKMIALRKSVLATIYTGILLNTTEYPLIRALNDIDDYYNAGTLPGAVIGITTEAGATVKEADEKIEVLLPPRTIEFVEPERQKRVAQILDNIDKLSDNRALELIKNPPVKDDKIEEFVKKMDPRNKRFVDGDAARKILKIKVGQGNRSDEALDAWEASLKAN